MWEVQLSSQYHSRHVQELVLHGMLRTTLILFSWEGLLSLEFFTVLSKLKDAWSNVVQGVLKALSVNKLTRCGVTFKFWCAPYSYHTATVAVEFF